MARKAKQPAAVAPADASADALSIAVAASALLLTVLLLRWKRSQKSAVVLRTSAEPPRKPAAGKGPMTILWGSQTGTAEGFASVLMREARQHGYAARSVDLEELEPDELADTRGPVVFLLATQGEGDPTDNAVAFYKWASESSRGADELAAISFAAFGLGNRQYEHFNSMGKWVDMRLPQLGATRLLELGLGDDDANIEADFEAWRASLWSMLCPLDAGEIGAPQPNFAAEIVGSAPATGPHPPVAWLQVMFPKQKLVASELLVSRELCQDASQGSVRHMELATAAGQDKPSLRYDGADDLAVLCDNGSDLAAATAERLGLSPRATFRLRPLSGGVRDLPGPSPPLPTPCAVADALRYYADLRAPVSKQMLLLLSEHTSDPAQAARLAHLASAAGKDEYTEYVHAQERGLAELLTEFPASAPPLGPLLELVPKLSPRYYTISSASSLNPATLHMTVKVIREPMRGAPHRTKLGVCTTQLEAAPVGSHVVAFVRPSHFRLPRDPTTPVVMVGPGTGIAPFRAFLQELQVAAAGGAPRTAHTRLYFGCRYSSVDFLYRGELEAALKAKHLSALRTAFSRESAKKVYVQDLMRADAKQLWPLFATQGAHLYICGGTTMGRDVVAELHAMAVLVGRKSQADATAFVQRMEAEGRLVKELWS